MVLGAALVVLSMRRDPIRAPYGNWTRLMIQPISRPRLWTMSSLSRRHRARKRRVTLLYAAKDPERNNAVALKSFLLASQKRAARRIEPSAI